MVHNDINNIYYNLMFRYNNNLKYVVNFKNMIVLFILI